MGVYIGPTHTEEDVWVEVGELQMLVGPGGQKVSKTMTRPHQYVHNLFGNVAIKKNPLVTSDSNCSQLQTAKYSLPGITGTFSETGFYGQMRPK